MAGCLLLAGTFVPTRLGPVEQAWMAFAHAISRVTTPLMMAILYFALLTPMALAHRLLAGSPVVHRPGTSGYWKTRAQRKRVSNLERQF